MRSHSLLLLLLAITVLGPLATADDSACVIVKRMGPADEITSHLYSFGLRGKQFQYVEGAFPKGMKFHGRLTDHDVRDIFDKGGRIAVVEQKYSPDDLKAARESCHAAKVPKDSQSAIAAPGTTAGAAPQPDHH